MDEPFPGMPEPQPKVVLQGPADVGIKPCHYCAGGTHRRYAYGDCTCTCHSDQVWVSVSWELQLSGYIDIVGLARKFPHEFIEANNDDGHTQLGAFLNDSMESVERDLTDISADPTIVHDSISDPDWSWNVKPDQEERFYALLPHLREDDDG